MMVVRGTCAALLALAVLSGCASTTQPPAGGFSAAERMAYAEQSADRLWQSSPFPDQRPDGITPVLVEGDTWGSAVVLCLADAGFDGYTAQGGGVSWSGGNESEEEQLARLTCFTSFVQDPAAAGQLNSAELGYLYDYYREVTVPCLTMAGVTVVDAPTRAEFIEMGVGWSPDLSVRAMTGDSVELGQSPWYRSAAGTPLGERCPSWPPEWQLDQR
jgi:hypothetical protein